MNVLLASAPAAFDGYARSLADAGHSTATVETALEADAVALAPGWEYDHSALIAAALGEGLSLPAFDLADLL